MALSTADRERYARHLTLPHVGADGQARIRAASVLIVGLGGLGSPAALYLAAAGVGRLGLLDFDSVAVHNLQRQILHDTASVGRAKTDSARARVEALNPGVRVDTWNVALTRENARGIIADYDVVIDGTDTFATRYLLNDACVLERTPLVHASVHRFEGQLSVFAARGQCAQLRRRRRARRVARLVGHVAGRGSAQADSRHRHAASWTIACGGCAIDAV
jgi:molybdopterin/thiamine biosynthesis adenylyltransferase